MSSLVVEVAVDVLLEAANKVNQIIPAKSIKPAISNILLQVMDGVLEVHGTDLMVSATYLIPSAVVESEGSLLINGALFVDLLKGCKGLTAKLIALPNNHLSFTAPGVNLTLAAGDPRDFPALPRLDTQPGFVLKGSDLTDMIAKTEFAVTADQTRGMATHGVCVELQRGHIRLVATDTRRLTFAERPATFDPSLAFTAVLPIGCVRLIQKVISKDMLTGDVTIGLSSSQVFIRGTNFMIGAGTLQGSYPPYQSALGIVLAQAVDFDRAALRTLINRASLVDESAGAFRFTQNKLTIASTSRMVGVSTVDMEIAYSGPAVSIGFNLRFLEDGLAVMKSSRCRFYFEHHLKAGMLRELADDGNGNYQEVDTYTYMVMPQHIEGENVTTDEGE